MQVISDRERLAGMAVYPGVTPEESRVLRQFIKRHGAEYDEFRFMVRIGDGVVLGEEYSPEVRRSWEAITKARPDTVAFKAPDLHTLIEAKVTWTNEAVWQLLAYRDLYAREVPLTRIALVGVAQYAGPTARELAKRARIALYLYNLPAYASEAGEILEEAPAAAGEAGS